MDLPSSVARVVESLPTPVEVLECDPALADTAAFCEHYGYPLSHSANTIIVAARRGPPVYAACVVAADTSLDVNHRVRAELGVPKLSFATAAETVDLTGMELGGVTVFGLPADLPVLVSESLLELDYVILGAGSRSAKLKAAPTILTDLSGSRVVTGLARA